MFDLFFGYLQDKLKKDIIKTKRENQQVEYRVTLDSIENVFGDHLCVFIVLQSSTKGKIKDILKVEEKLRIESDGKSYTGTLVDIVDNELHVLLYHQISLNEYKIVRLLNFNNHILSDELKRLKTSKELEIFVFSSFIKCIIRKSEELFKILSPDKISDKHIAFYIFIRSYITNTDKDTVLGEIKRILKLDDITAISKCLDDIQIEKKDTLSFLIEMIDEIYDLYEKKVSKGIVNDLEVDLSNLSLDLGKDFIFFDNCLNFSQKEAVKAINGCTSYKIIGPPGTGKTSTIVEIISQLLKKKQKILVCGPSNISIDNIIEKFLSSNWYSKIPTKFYRRGSAFKGLTKFNLESIVDEMTKFVVKEKTDKNFKRTLKRIKETYKKEIQSETDLVFSTTFSSRKESNDFDWVIIDEACQSSAVECFLSLTHGKKFILVGDPNQLCPESRSLYEILDMKTYLLDVQYRMCERLISFSNESFYDSKIKSFIKESHSIIENSPLVFVDTRTTLYQETVDKTSKMNIGEAELVVKLISCIKSNDIGVISPYSAQVLLLKEKLPTIEVATVDGFQGREKEFIIISLVRSNIDGNFGFLDNFKRLNVAITRCKKGLIIVGNSDNFRKCGVISRFFKFIDKHFISIDPLEIEEYFENDE